MNEQHRGRMCVRSLFAAAATIGFVAAGCSGSDSTSSSGGGGESSSDAELQVSSPLLDLFADSPLLDDPNSGEEEIAKCMVERGWEYTPMDLGGTVDSEELLAEASDNQLFDAEFRRTFGYGISTRYGDDGKIKEGAPGYALSQLTGAEDPNADYVSKLSQEEQGRYYSDLFGSNPNEVGLLGGGADANGDPNADPNADPNGGGGGSDLDTGIEDDGGTGAGGLAELEDAFAASCSAKGLPVQGESMNRISELFTQLDEASENAGLGDDSSLASKHPELREAEDAWSECMAKSDHDFENVKDASQSISTQFDKLSGNEIADPGLIPSDGGAEPPADEANPDPAAAPIVETGADSDGGDAPSIEEAEQAIEDFSFGGGFDPEKMDMTKLHKLQKDELELAQQDHDCQAATYRPVYVEVRQAAEQKVIDDNADVVSELKKAMAGKGDN